MTTMPGGQDTADAFRQSPQSWGSGEPAPGAAESEDAPATSARPQRQPLATAILASAFIHLVAMVLAALITVGGGQAGGASPDELDTIGIAVLTEAELGQLADAALDASTPAISDALEDPLAVQFDLQIPETLAAFDEPLNLAGAAADLTTGLGAGDLSGGALGGAGGAASFFGVEAKGTRFAYVVDISGSMEVGIGTSNLTRIAVLQRELGRSVVALSENSRFFVALFSTHSQAMGGKLEWTAANEPGKAWARRTISQIQAGGGTEPLPAFRMVFALRPRPDAIYFMTDGEFDYDVPRQIALMNADLRIPIHTICFDSTEGEALMRKIAKESGGTYTYVPGVPR
jgi:hypothetical protein